MQVIHVSDTHLGRQEYGYEFRELDGYELFNKVVEDAIEEHIKLIVLSGDLFDEAKPRNRALRTVVECFRRLREKGVKVVLIPGDHDYPRKRDILPLYVLDDIFDNVVLLGVPYGDGYRTEYVLESEKIAFYALPFTPFKTRIKKYLPRFLQTASNFFREHSGYKHVLLAHYSVKEYMPYDAVLSLSDIPCVTYAAFGHIHSRIKTMLPSGGLLAYPGSLDIYRRDEIQGWLKYGKGYNLVDLSIEPDPSMVEWINLDVRKQVLYRIKSSELDSLYGIVERELEGVTKKPIIIHLTVAAKTSERVNIARYIEKLSPSEVLIRHHIEYIDDEEKSIVSNGDEPVGYDEVEVLARYMGVSREAAEIVYEIVEGIASNSLSREEIEEKILRLKEYIRKPVVGEEKTTSDKKAVDRKKRIEGIKKSLLEYLSSS